MIKIFPFNKIDTADLIVDAVYEGGTTGKIRDEALCKVLPGIGNLGGFRASGTGLDKKFVVLYTSGKDMNWPDLIDLSSGQFIYYGDNKTPGHDLHDTRPGGNRILRRVFEHLHFTPPKRELIPPFFIFTRYPTEKSSRSVQFNGLAAPGFPGIPATEDLLAIWKTSRGQRFQNYKSVFTILDVPVISRTWITSLAKGAESNVNTPAAWKEWVHKGRYHPLTSEPTTIIRTLDDQIPDTSQKRQLLSIVFEYFKDAPFLFENFAARIFQMQDQRVAIDRVTRNVIDGGRDAVGRYRLGLIDDPVKVEFALEAKCYAPSIRDKRPSTVGVKGVARLISRLRHRQFGVLVTTSAIARQAYQEVREDKHPIVFISGKDIAEILITSGYNSKQILQNFLEAEFPHPDYGAGDKREQRDAVP
ncbi:MAG: restriction endonuclease [Pseudomonadota bacterium]